MRLRRLGILFAILLLAASSLLNFVNSSSARALSPSDLGQVKFAYNSTTQKYQPQGPATTLSGLSAQYSYVMEDGAYKYYVGNKQIGNGCASDFIRVSKQGTPTASYYRMTTGNGADSLPGLPTNPNFVSAVTPRPECKFDRSYVNVTTAGIGTPVDTGSNPSNTTQEDDQVKACEDRGKFFGWIFCAVISALNGVITYLYSFAIDRLDFSLFAPVGPAQDGITGLSQDNYNAVKSSWQVVTRISSSLLVVAFLIMIIGQATANFMDAYTVKKVLPRLVVAFILINVSWYLAGAAQEITNIIASGVREIILAPFGTSANAGAAIVTPSTARAGALTGGATVGIGLIISAGLNGIFGATALATVAPSIIFALPGLLLTAAIGVFLGMAVVVLRQGLIILLTVFISVPIALYVLEGTRKYANKYQDLFVGVLLVYPIFQIVLAVGAVLATVVSATNNASSDDGSGTTLFRFLIALICFFAPYFLLPKIIQLSSSALHTIYSAASGRASGMVGSLNKSMAERKQQTEAYVRQQGKKGYKQQQRTLRGAASYNPSRWSAPFSSARTRAGTAQLMSNYATKNEMERWQDINPAHMQLLAMGGGTSPEAVQRARQMGVDSGLIRNEQDQARFTQTAELARQRGFDATNSSTLRAIAEMGAPVGMMAPGFLDYLEEGAGGAINPVEGGGMATRLRLEARSKGSQYSVQPTRLTDFGKVSVSDIPTAVTALANQPVEDDNGRRIISAEGIRLDPATGQPISRDQQFVGPDGTPLFSSLGVSARLGNTAETTFVDTNGKTQQGPVLEFLPSDIRATALVNALAKAEVDIGRSNIDPDRYRVVQRARQQIVDRELGGEHTELAQAFNNAIQRQAGSMATQMVHEPVPTARPGGGGTAPTPPPPPPPPAGGNTLVVPHESGIILPTEQDIRRFGTTPTAEDIRRQIENQPPNNRPGGPGGTRGPGR